MNQSLIEESLNTIFVCFIQPMEPIKCLLLSPSLCLSKLLFAISGFIFANKCQTPQTGGLDLADPPEVSFHRGHWAVTPTLTLKAGQTWQIKKIYKRQISLFLSRLQNMKYFIFYTHGSHMILYFIIGNPCNFGRGEATSSIMLVVHCTVRQKGPNVVVSKNVTFCCFWIF